jgi:hypothetical protein
MMVMLSSTTQYKIGCNCVRCCICAAAFYARTCLLRWLPPPMRKIIRAWTDIRDVNLRLNIYSEGWRAAAQSMQKAMQHCAAETTRTIQHPFVCRPTISAGVAAVKLHASFNSPLSFHSSTLSFL